MAYFVPLQRLGLLTVLSVMLVTAQLPLHASLSGFLTFWLPWIALDVAASTLLCRGRASLWDGTYSLLLTLEIFARSVMVVMRPAASTFKVTPKDGIDDGGWHAVRQLHLVLVIALVLFSALWLRALTALGLAPLPKLAGAPLVIGMALGVWELALVVAALIKVSHRRQHRRHYRTQTEVVGIMDNVIVRVVDLTPEGAGLLSPHAVTPGRVVELLAELPTVEQRTRLVRLRLTDTDTDSDSDSGTDAAAPRVWRVGGTLTARHAADHDALVEYCHVVAARSRLAESGRLLPGPAAASELAEPLAVSG
jgi:hypothetical protein